ncbi:hypothetical protein HHI36_010479 [Cryptolaemus montrouzieri]|uniref:Uncharacterized protein n=1 Tax=Cryptolaemus montrouzieri TaxID=559131 RepID=A0ABD2MIX3_9CUCU
MCCAFSGKIVVLICIWRLNIVVSTENSTNTAVKPPRHRGAARQMFGSGSLRPRDSRPVYATGQRHYGERSTVSPDSSGYQILPELPPYPVLPYPFSYGDDVFPVPEVIGGSRSSTRSGLPRPVYRGGLYGGRPEYYSGKPNHGIIGGKNPFDLGQIRGKGFERATYFDTRKYKGIVPPGKSKDLMQSSDDLIDTSEEEFEHSCGFNCAPEEYLCVSSCICIKSESRCDGEFDCQDNEDEMGCEEYELMRHQKCEDKPNKIRCPSTKKCILKEWLCDGDDDCGAI